MKSNIYIRLQAILSKFSHVHGFLNDDFIREQCKGRLTNHILKRLNNKETNSDIQRHLPTLERRLADLASPSGDYNGEGYDRLGPLLRHAADWDQYQEALAQIDITLWFKQKGLLKEIEPVLPHRNGNADIRLSFCQQDIYCECTSFQSIARSMQAKAHIKDAKAEKKLEGLQKTRPWSKQGDAEERIKTKQAMRKLRGKIKRQLPLDCPGILALDTTKSAIFAFDVRMIAGRLLHQTPQLALIALWSWEGWGEESLSWDKYTPSHFFVNANSNFRSVGEALLDSLDLTGEVVT